MGRVDESATGSLNFLGQRSPVQRVRLTVILKAALAVFALESVAEHLTTVLPMRNRLPDRGAQVA